MKTLCSAACADWKRISAAVAAVFVVWSVTDILLHGVLLSSTYAATAPLWRPMPEMKGWLIHIVSLVAAGAFVKIYALLCSPRTVTRGLFFGLHWGVAAGASMGFGTYAVMPIPGRLALAWCLGTIVQCALAGLVVGTIFRDPPAA